MKEQKRERPVQAQQGLAGVEAAEERNGVQGADVVAEPEHPGPRPSVAPIRPKPRSTMQSVVQTRKETQSRKGRGRLNRETLSRLGKTLEAYYDDVRKEGVPDRFRDLLEQYDANKDKGSS
jgi:hypothetical protein